MDRAAEPARLVTPGDRTPGHPTPGMRREQAIDVPNLWAGMVHTQPGSVSGWHHHGEYETSIFVVSGTMRMESGPGGGVVMEASAGDFLYVPAFAVHREANPGESESHAVIVRAGHGEPVINVDGPAAG